MAMRLELSQAGDAFLAGNNQLYNVLVTAHAFLMIFFFCNAYRNWWICMLLNFIKFSEYKNTKKTQQAYLKIIMRFLKAGFYSLFSILIKS